MRYVAEDVAVYNSDIIGGKMKELLFGLGRARSRRRSPRSIASSR